MFNKTSVTDDVLHDILARSVDLVRRLIIRLYRLRVNFLVNPREGISLFDLPFLSSLSELDLQNQPDLSDQFHQRRKQKEDDHCNYKLIKVDTDTDITNQIKIKQSL